MKLKKERRSYTEFFPVNSHMGKDLVFNEGFTHPDGRNVDILQMGPPLERYMLEVNETTKERDKSQTFPGRLPPGYVPVSSLIS